MDATSDQQQSTSKTNEYREGSLRAFVEKIKEELGDNPDLIKQSIADLNAQQRQEARNHFESRQEYIRQVFQIKQDSLVGIREYGLQTLKWLFLLNAGAIAVVLTYVGGALGRPTSGMAGAALVPVLTSLWPFVVGCAMVVVAGASGFFNFSYGEASLPSLEGLHNFTDPKSSSWPQPRMGQLDRKVVWSRNVAIILAVCSTLFFVYGVFRVLHAALKQLG